MTGRLVRQISLTSLLVLIAPMVLFPDLLGTGLAKASVGNAFYEVVYYAVVTFFLYRRASLRRIVQAAGLCLVYRLLLGALFGLLITAMYSMNLAVSLSLGLASYLPAMLLHIAVTPFILKPAIAQFAVSPKGRPRPPEEPIPADVPEHGQMIAAVSVEPAARRPAPTGAPEPRARLSRESHAGFPLSPEPAEANGFDRAVRYVGEDGSVQLAVVVDDEGLLLGQFERGQSHADDWAPFALLFCDANGAALRRAGWGSPDKIDLVVKDTRIIVAREDSWCLMVVAQRHGDDLLNIRINQGVEIIRKYIARRYGQKLSVKTEKTYVSSA